MTGAYFLHPHPSPPSVVSVPSPPQIGQTPSEETSLLGRVGASNPNRRRMGTKLPYNYWVRLALLVFLVGLGFWLVMAVSAVHRAITHNYHFATPQQNQYLVRQGYSLEMRYDIYNETDDNLGTAERQLYQVIQTKVWRSGLTLSFQDMDGNQLASIKQTWKDSLKFAQYEIWRDGVFWAEIRSDNTVFGPNKTWYESRLLMDISGPNDYHIVGKDFFNWQFTVERTNGNLAGTIEQVMMRVQDAYNVIVENGQDDIAILLLSIVLDQVFHEAD